MNKTGKVKSGQAFVPAQYDRPQEPHQPSVLVILRDELCANAMSRGGTSQQHSRAWAWKYVLIFISLQERCGQQGLMPRKKR